LNAIRTQGLIYKKDTDIIKGQLPLSDDLILTLGSNMKNEMFKECLLDGDILYFLKL